MTKKYVLTVIAVATMIAGTVLADEEKQGCSSCSDKAKTTVSVEEKAQTLCPVMGSPVNKEIYVDHNGKRVYFCCAACVETFRKDPDIYLEKLKKDGVKLEDTPKPVEKKTS